MEINRSCSTCEFNFAGTCVSGGELEYGENTKDFDIERSCWSLSLDYFEELAEELPENERFHFEHSDLLDDKALIHRLEKRVWIYKKREFTMDDKGKWNWIKKVK